MSNSKTINCIDIGTTKVTTVIAQVNPEDHNLNVIAAASLPSVGFRKGQIVNLEQAAATIISSIESAERMAGFAISSADICLSAPHIESINSQGLIAINNPNGEINQVDIDRAVEASKTISLPASKEIIHIIPRSYTVDGENGIIDPVGMNGLRLEVSTHLILASTPSLRNLQKCLGEVGIKINSLTYSGLAAAESTLTNTEKELGVALVDIGGANTSITIFIENSPCFSSVIPLGGNNITNDLAIGLRFSLDEAEKIKTSLDRILQSQKYEDEVDLKHFDIVADDNRKLSISTAITGIIKPRLEEIFEIIYQEIQRSGFASSIPAGLVITGGGALTPKIREIGAQVVPLPIRVGTPRRLGGLVDDILSPAYSSTIGIMLLQHHRPTFKTSQSKDKPKLNTIFDRIKGLIEPLLP